MEYAEVAHAKNLHEFGQYQKTRLKLKHICQRHKLFSSISHLFVESKYLQARTASKTTAKLPTNIAMIDFLLNHFDN